MNNLILLTLIAVLVSIGGISSVSAAEVGDVISTFEINNSTTNGPNFSDDDRFAHSLTNIGDFDGDGIEDIAITSFLKDSNGSEIYIITLNSDSSLKKTIKINNSTSSELTWHSPSYFGSAIANIGDLNGDGIDDIAIGASSTTSSDTGGSYQGAVYIITLNATGYSLSSVKINDFTPNGPVLNHFDHFGRSIANIGDIDGNGVNDIAVGSIGGLRGAVHIITLNATGYPLSSVKIDDSTPNGPVLSYSTYFGKSIANIGDIDGNGVNDIAVGASDGDTGGSRRGTVHIITLNSDGYPLKTFEINSTTPNGPDLSNLDYFGSSIANIGDINGDGTIDIAVGARGDDTGGSFAGAVHIITLNATGYPLSTVKINNSTANGPDLDDGDYFGFSITNIGDINGDQINDIAVGAYGDDIGGLYTGTVHIITLYGKVVPDAPTGLNATRGNTQVELFWSAPTFDGNTPITDYILEYGNGTSWTIFDDGISTITNGNVTGLTNDVQYWFQVSAVNSAGTGLSSGNATAIPVSSVILYCGEPESFYDNVINGTESRDRLMGTNLSDLIFGFGESDYIRGYGGDDCIYAGDGDDYVHGGYGNDIIYAGDGDDYIEDGKGNDIIYAGTGDDDVRISSGTDIAYGEEGNDILHVVAIQGTIIDGGDGSDMCIPENDQVTFTETNCEMPTSTDTIIPAIDELFCGEPISFYDSIINGTDSADYLVGTDQKDLILGYGGNDFIQGLNNRDCLIGGDGDDYINGGKGSDGLYGGNGNDIIRPDRGIEPVFGEAGNDILIAPRSNLQYNLSTLNGGDGYDMCLTSGDYKSYTDCELK